MLNLIAHGFGRAYGPASSRQALGRALAGGPLWGLETDCVLTRDDQLVLLRSPKLAAMIALPLPTFAAIGTCIAQARASNGRYGIVPPFPRLVGGLPPTAKRRVRPLRGLGVLVSSALAFSAAFAVAVPTNAFAAAPAVTISPTSKAFGSQDVNAGPTASQTFTITNSGDATLNIWSAYWSEEPDQFVNSSATPCVGFIAPGDNCTFTVAFNPTVAGSVGEELYLLDNAGSGTQTVTMTGPGMAAPAVSITPAAWFAPVHIDSFNDLHSISCPTTTFCAAVDGTSSVYIDNNGTWSGPTTLGTGLVNGVSCTAASFCVAVDSRGSVYVYDGSAWTERDTVSAHSFTAISCVTPSFCIAVDNYGAAFLYSGGNSWGIWTYADGTTAINSVSCPTISFCMATDVSGGVLTYDGSSWSSPYTMEAGRNLTALSCGSSSYCIAGDTVGDYFSYRGGGYSGWGWNQHLDGSDPYVAASCPSVSVCTMINSVGSARTWSNITGGAAPVSADSGNTPSAISCATVSFCVVTDTSHAVTYSAGHDFGNQIVGTDSATQTFTLKNTGDADLHVSMVSMPGSNFVYHSSTCATVTPGSTCTISVSFHPGSLGVKGATVSVYDDAGDSPQTIPLTGTGVIGPATQLAFTQTPGGAAAGTAFSTQPQITVEDAGGNTVTTDSSWASVVLAIGSNPGSGTLSGCTTGEVNGVIIFGGCRINYGGTGYTLTASDGSLTTASSSAFDVTGTPAVSITPGLWSAPSWSYTPASFPSVSCTSATFCVSVTGVDVFTYNGSAWSGATIVDPGHTLVSVSCTATPTLFCAAVDSGGHAVTYNGTSWSSPVVSHTGGQTRISCATATFCEAVEANGNAVTYDGTWPSPVGIGPGSLLAVSCPSASFCAASDNEGDVLMYNGSGWSAPPHLAGPSPLPSISCTSASFCAVADPNGEKVWTYDGMTWSSTSFGGYPLYVSCSASTFCAAVNAFGDASTYNGTTWSSPTLVDGSHALSSVSCPTSSFCMAVDNGGNTLTYTVGNNYGNQIVNTSSTSQTFVVTNTGTSGLHVTSATLVGTNPDQFTITGDTCTTDGPIVPGSSCDVYVKFAPTSTGDQTASLSLATDAADTPEKAALTGTGVSAPTVVSATPAEPQGATAQTVTVTGTGFADGAVITFANTGVTGSTTSVNSTTLTVSVTVAADASIGASDVTVTNTDGGVATGSGVFTVVSGPAVSISPGGQTFGNQNILSGPTADQTFTVTNTGTSDLHGTGAPSITGTDAANFNYTGGTCFSGPVAPGDSCTVTVNFSPLTSGLKVAYLNIADDAEGSPQTVEFTVTGTFRPPT